MSAWIGNFEQVGFQGGFEGREGGGVSDALGEFIPEGGGGHGEGPVAPGSALGLGDLEEASPTGPEGTSRDMWLEEVGEVRGSQVMQCFVGGEEYFEVDSLFDRQPVEVMEDWCDVVSGAGAGE